VAAAATEVWVEEAGPGWLARQVALQRDAAVIWSPVLIIAGVWTYFALPVEPPVAVIGGASLLLIALAVPLWLGRGGFAMLAFALAIAGFLLAKAQTARVEAPILTATTGSIPLSGIVETIDWRGASRCTVVVKMVRLESLPEPVRPERLRLDLNQCSRDMAPGQEIGGQVSLRPLPVPVIPNGFDYGRQLYLNGIGATGRFIGEVTILSRAMPAYWLRNRIYELRETIGARIQSALPGGRGSLAEALITGNRGGVPKTVTDSLQVSGLAHILSISGLHMSLVAGGIFWLVRALLALSPAMALHRPIKKWAAGAALAAGFGYMLIAGADVATQRSYIMLAIIFLAVIADRPAFSMRNLALAALVILISQPAAALSASFHMSFMAVMGLAAFYEAYSHWRAGRFERANTGRIRRLANWLFHILFGMAATTLVAGTLSSIPAAYHFGRVAPLSLAANLLALPVVSFIVMPAATLSVVLMPLGLEALPLWVMGKGLEVVMFVSDWVAGFPLSRLAMPLLPGPAAIAMAGGAIWLCLWRGTLRYAGAGLVLAGVVVIPLERIADILIDPVSDNVAVRNNDGKLAIATATGARFAVKRWLQAEGDTVSPGDAAERAGWVCKGPLCKATVKGTSIVYARERADLTTACPETDILIAAFPLRGACPSIRLRIDRFDVWRNGAYALYVAGDEITVLTSRGAQGARPWVVKPVARRALVTGSGRVPSTHFPAVQQGAIKPHDEKESSSDDDGASPRGD
jgi:competence protein ComEC